MTVKLCYIASLGSTHTERWINYFANAGHEVHLIDTNELPSGNVKKIKLHRVKKLDTHIRIIDYLIDPLISALRFFKIVWNINPDIVHAHSLTYLTMFGAISRIHPFIFTAWGSDVLIAPGKSKLLRWIIMNIINNADLITCDAEHIIEPLVQYGASRQRIKLVNFGVDTRKFNLKPKDEKLMKGIDIIGSPIIISLRRFFPIYNVETLIAAIPMVIKEVSTAKFIIAGNGPQEDALKELAKSLHVYDSIRFVGYIPNDDEVSRYLSSADIYVSTSLSDAGIASSTAQAMACGLPVVITDFGDNGKWVENGMNGFLIPLSDPKTLAEKIIYLLQHEDVRKNFGKINRKIIEDKNDYYNEMKKMENIYMDLIEVYK